MSSESLIKNLTRRKLMLSDITANKDIREVIQLNYLSWPDHGAPELTDYEIIEKLIDIIKEFHQPVNLDFKKEK